MSQHEETGGLPVPHDLEAQLRGQVIGQEQAVEAVCMAMRRFRAAPADRRRPMAVLLLAGPRGVGKTTLACVLAPILFGSDEALVHLDMAEFAGETGVMNLVGLMPTYPTAEEGHLLAALRRRPQCVVLLERIELAHPAVADLLVRIFEWGHVLDAHRHPVDARGALFLLTSTAGAEVYAGMGRAGAADDLGDATGWEDERRRVERAVRANVSPELMNHVGAIAHFFPLSRHSLCRITDLILGPVESRLAERWGVRLTVTPAAREYLVGQYDPGRGAGSLERAVDALLVGPLAQVLLAGSLPAGGAVVADFDGRQIVLG